MRTIIFLSVCGLVFACSEKEKAGESGGDEGSAKAGDSKAGDSKTGAGATEADKTTPPAPAEDICGCRMLTKHSFDALDTGTHEKNCGGTPLIEGNRCNQYDTLRNCIYAAHGYKFKTKKYQKHFGKIAWYKARDDFKKSELSKVEVANVRLLKEKAKACRERLSSVASKGDVKFVKAWFKNRAKQIPPIIWHEIEEGETKDAESVEARIGYMELDDASVKISKSPEPTDSGLQKRLKGKKYRTLHVSECVECEEDESDCEAGCYNVFELVVSDKDEVLAIYLTVAAG